MRLQAYACKKSEINRDAIVHTPFQVLQPIYGGRDRFKVSSKTIDRYIYTHVGNTRISKAKNELNSLQMKGRKTIYSFIPPDWHDIQTKLGYE